MPNQPNPSIVHIEVTQDDIDVASAERGSWFKSQSCPIYRALARKYPAPPTDTDDLAVPTTLPTFWLDCVEIDVVLWALPSLSTLATPLPKNAREFIEGFDAGALVTPITFDLDLSALLTNN